MNEERDFVELQKFFVGVENISVLPKEPPPFTKMTVDRELIQKFLKTVKRHNILESKEHFLMKESLLYHAFDTYYASETGVKKQLTFDTIYKLHVLYLRQRVDVLKVNFEDQTSETFVYRTSP